MLSRAQIVHASRVLGCRVVSEVQAEVLLESPPVFVLLAELAPFQHHSTTSCHVPHPSVSRRLLCSPGGFLEDLGFELATPTPAAWVEIFGRSLSLWEEQQPLLPQHPNLLAAPPTILADCANLVAQSHVHAYPFGANSMASQVGASAWFISIVF